MEHDAPTFVSMSDAQRRALVLRDKLRFLEAHHLDEYLLGVAEQEPPAYQLQDDGIIEPPLESVGLWEEAERYEIGNVDSLQTKGEICRVTLVVVDGGKIEVHRRAALPLEMSVPIHAYYVKTMVLLYQQKFQGIINRMNELNAARRKAYEKVVKGGKEEESLFVSSASSVEDVKPLPKRVYNFTHNAVGAPASNANITTATIRHKKRQVSPSAEASASKKVMSMHTEPVSDEIKRKAFGMVPDQVKIAVFDNIANSMFPQFGNLVQAASNVVKVYNDGNAEFPDIHTVIENLNEAIGEVDRKPADTVPYRQDLHDTAKTNTIANLGRPDHFQAWGGKQLAIDAPITTEEDRLIARLSSKKGEKEHVQEEIAIKAQVVVPTIEHEDGSSRRNRSNSTKDNSTSTQEDDRERMPPPSQHSGTKESHREDTPEPSMSPPSSTSQPKSKIRRMSSVMRNERGPTPLPDIAPNSELARRRAEYQASQKKSATASQLLANRLSRTARESSILPKPKLQQGNWGWSGSGTQSSQVYEPSPLRRPVLRESLLLQEKREEYRRSSDTPTSVDQNSENGSASAKSALQQAREEYQKLSGGQGTTADNENTVAVSPPVIPEPQKQEDAFEDVSAPAISVPQKQNEQLNEPTSPSSSIASDTKTDSPGSKSSLQQLQDGYGSSGDEGEDEGAGGPVQDHQINVRERFAQFFASKNANAQGKDQEDPSESMPPESNA